MNVFDMVLGEVMLGAGSGIEDSPEPFDRGLGEKLDLAGMLSIVMAEMTGKAVPEPPVKPHEWKADARAAELAARLERSWIHPVSQDGRCQAFCRMDDHSVHIPRKERFAGDGSMLMVLLHECAHSTSGDLGRISGSIEDGVRRSGVERCLEEFTAQMAAAKALDEAGLLGEDELAYTVIYIRSWLSACAGNPAWLFRIEKDAGKACAMLVKAMGI